MGRTISALPTFLVYTTFVFTFALAQSSSILPQPQSLASFIPNNTHTQNQGTCSFTVSIKTSCSSPKYTRDEISLSFGDAYGNQVYAPRLDDPRSKTFERCSTDTFEVSGPCTYQICYLYLYRSGYDGWKPETVKLYGYHVKAVSFYYNTFIPNGVWYGFNLCNAVSGLASSA
ncbi:hypothetical protein CsatA_021871 [Cannabis sativa]